MSEGFESPDVLWAEQPRLVHNLLYFTLLVAYCGLCHQSAVYYMIVESRPYVKLFRLITLIPTLLLILQCLLPPKEASLAMLLFGGEVTDVESVRGRRVKLIQRYDTRHPRACP